MNPITTLIRRLTRWAWRPEIETCEGIAVLRGIDMDDKGMDLRIQQDPALAQWHAKCFASLVAKSENYTEMRFETDGAYKGKYEWVTVLIQKGNGKTPHQLRQEAEDELANLKTSLTKQSPRGNQNPAVKCFRCEKQFRLPQKMGEDPYPIQCPYCGYMHTYNDARMALWPIEIYD